MDQGQRQRLYEAIVHGTAETHFLLSPDGEVRFVSDSVGRSTGWHPDDLRGLSALELVHPDDRDAVEGMLGRLRAEPGQLERSLHRMRSKDGSFRTVEFLASSLAGDPEIAGVVVTARDAEELAALRTAREQSERRLVEVADAVDDILTVLRYRPDVEEPEILWISNADLLFDRIGIQAQVPADPAETLALIQTKILPDSIETLAQIRRDTRAGKPVNETLMLLGADGSPTWWWYRARPQARPDGSIEVMCAATDITEPRRVLEQLEERTHQLDILLDHVQAGVAYADSAGRILLCNQEMRNLLGTDDEAPCADTVDDLLGAIAGLALDSHATRVVLDRHVPADDPVDIRFEDGRLVEIASERMSEANVEGRLWLLRDVTAQREASEHLIRSQQTALDASRQQAEFLENMHRELRMPLRGIMDTLDALEDNDPEALRTAHDLVRGSVRSLWETLERLGSDFAARQDLQPEPYPAASPISSVARLLAPVVHGKGLRLDVDTSRVSGLRLTRGENRIRQLLFQLLTNAIKATDDGHVSVVCTPHGEAGIRLVVSDTGAGLPAEAQAILRGELGRDETSTGRVHRLAGLPLARRLVEDMGGSVELEVAESSSGTGTTIRVNLPDLGVATEPRHETPQPRVRSHDSRRPAVLVVDDTRANAELAQLQLERLGCSAEVAASGAAALDAVQRQRFDLVLMDCNMPELDGLSATRRIRDELADASSLVPIVAMTATAMRRERERALEAGMDDFLGKPVRLADLERILARWGQPLSAENLVDDAAVTDLIDELGDANTFATAAGVFLRELPARREAVAAAWRSGDSEALRGAAHTIKGAAGAFAAVRLQTAAAALEMAAKDGIPDHELGVLVRELLRVAWATQGAYGRYVDAGVNTHSPSR